MTQPTWRGSAFGHVASVNTARVVFSRTAAGGLGLRGRARPALSRTHAAGPPDISNPPLTLERVSRQAGYYRSAAN